jgi:hypothetical protein
VLVEPGRIGGLQESQVNTGEARNLPQESLESQILWWRLPSEEDGRWRKRQPALEGCPHPAGEVEGRPASSRQLVEDLLDKQELGPFEWAGEAEDPHEKRPWRQSRRADSRTRDNWNIRERQQQGRMNRGNNVNRWDVPQQGRQQQKGCSRHQGR